MTINDHVEEFHGLPVTDFREAEKEGKLPAADATAWRIGLDWDDEQGFAELWQKFLDTVEPERVTALVLGRWFPEEPESLSEALPLILAAADRLPALRALFLGDITFEECEISWIQMCDITPVFAAFPRLEELVVRGASEDYDDKERLGLKPVRHERLKALRFESGGLPAEIVRAVGACDFPALEKLELWLGVDNYGGNWTMDDLAPFLSGAKLPALTHLGLQDSVFQDQIAALVARAPVVPRLTGLSLSMGAFTDEGAAALLEGQPLTHLKTLDLHHHYLTEGMQQRLRDALPGVAVDLSGAEDPGDNWRYVAISE
ncbi:STM4015 family protein [Kitasatospora sp. YST-16]|uniref:STM4015 family protein n=1 Tax=unclassified Kitasatospora TaxID=2633591 RepID=UPI0004C3F0AA|nr:MULTISPECIES: STM4015 family protein [unclassified Kitasatospora]WAL73829.1 STM4015 family protein [Kitasatospora sp. YST-16]WNW39906.1 STM4015 family protein [Streptomyces sp. Li-HN-5-13]